MVAKNPVEQMKKQREQKQKEADKRAKLALLSEREIVKRTREKEKRKEIRDARLAKDAEEVRERQAEYRRKREQQEAQQKAQQEETMRKARVLLDHNKEDRDNSPCAPKNRARKRVRSEDEPSPSSVMQIANPVGAKPVSVRAPPATPAQCGVTAPRLSELMADNTYDIQPMPMPSLETVTALATMRVISSNTETGIGLWGTSSRRWSKPSGWSDIIQELTDAYTSFKDTDKNIVAGEYNAVFVSGVTKYADALPDFVAADGTAIPLDDVVFRITRPDVEHDSKKGDSTVRHRYKTLQEQADEMYYSLHGAANGYAIPVVAAMIFAGPKVRRKGKSLQLYGSMYVLKKAPVNMNTIMEDHSKHIACTKGLSIGSTEHSSALVKGARKVALRVLPVLVRQARLGGLYFDCKPANTLFVEGATVYLSDFDAAMYTVMRNEHCTWEGHLFMTLLLLSTHIRCYQPAGVAEGWASAMKPLLLDLAVAARTSSWLFDARVTDCAFVPGPIKTSADATSRLEMMVSAYFCDGQRTRYMKCNPRFDTRSKSKSLVSQLLKFVLTSSAISRDVEVCRVLGEVSY